MGAEPFQLSNSVKATDYSHVTAGSERLTAALRKRNGAGELAARLVNGAGWRPIMGPDHGYRAPVIRNARLELPQAQAVVRVIVESAAVAVKFGIHEEMR